MRKKWLLFLIFLILLAVPAYSFCLGDFNNDGGVDNDDFGLFQSEYGKEVSEETKLYDLDNDDDIDFADFTLFSKEVGKSCGLAKPITQAPLLYVRGVVFDSATNKPLRAEITYTSEEGLSPQLPYSTNTNGEFEFLAPQKVFNVKITSSSYEDSNYYNLIAFEDIELKIGMLKTQVQEPGETKTTISVAYQAYELREDFDFIQIKASDIFEGSEQEVIDNSRRSFTDASGILYYGIYSRDLWIEPRIRLKSGTKVYASYKGKLKQLNDLVFDAGRNTGNGCSFYLLKNEQGIIPLELCPGVKTISQPELAQSADVNVKGKNVPVNTEKWECRDSFSAFTGVESSLSEETKKAILGEGSGWCSASPVKKDFCNWNKIMAYTCKNNCQEPVVKEDCGLFGGSCFQYMPEENLVKQNLVTGKHIIEIGNTQPKFNDELTNEIREIFGEGAQVIKVEGHTVYVQKGFETIFYEREGLTSTATRCRKIDYNLWTKPSQDEEKIKMIKEKFDAYYKPYTLTNGAINLELRKWEPWILEFLTHGLDNPQDKKKVVFYLDRIGGISDTGELIEDFGNRGAFEHGRDILFIAAIQSPHWSVATLKLEDEFHKLVNADKSLGVLRKYFLIDKFEERRLDAINGGDISLLSEVELEYMESYINSFYARLDKLLPEFADAIDHEASHAMMDDYTSDLQTKAIFIDPDYLGVSYKEVFTHLLNQITGEGASEIRHEQVRKMLESYYGKEGVEIIDEFVRVSKQDTIMIGSPISFAGPDISNLDRVKVNYLESGIAEKMHYGVAIYAQRVKTSSIKEKNEFPWGEIEGDLIEKQGVPRNVVDGLKKEYKYIEDTSKGEIFFYKIKTIGDVTFVRIYYRSNLHNFLMDNRITIDQFKELVKYVHNNLLPRGAFSEILARMVDSLMSVYTGPDTTSKYRLTEEELAMFDNMYYKGKPMFGKAVEKYRLALKMQEIDGFSYTEARKRLEFATEYHMSDSIAAVYNIRDKNGKLIKDFYWPENGFTLIGDLKLWED